MVSSSLTILLGYLSCGFLLTTLAAPSPSVGNSLIKRGGQSDAPQPGASRFFRTRSTLAFNKEFNQITEIPGIEYSAVQFTDLGPDQKPESYWIPEDTDTSVAPVSYFFGACLDTPAGQIFKDALDGKIYKDSQVTLVNNCGTFDHKNGKYLPWNWSKDAIMAVSCTVFALDIADIPHDKAQNVDARKVKLLAESSTEMIANMKNNGWYINQVATPSHTRAELEYKIAGYKSKRH